MPCVLTESLSYQGPFSMPAFPSLHGSACPSAIFVLSTPTKRASATNKWPGAFFLRIDPAKEPDRALRAPSAHRSGSDQIDVKAPIRHAGLGSAQTRRRKPERRLCPSLSARRGRLCRMRPARGVGVRLSYNPLSSNGFSLGFSASPTLYPTRPTGTWRTSQAESAPFSDRAGKTRRGGRQTCPVPAETGPTTPRTQAPSDEVTPRRHIAPATATG